MTVPATARRAGPYNGNGSTTSFSFSFKTFAAGDLLVTKMDALGVETTLVLNSDYSVTLNGDQDASPGGSITYPLSGSALPTGQKLTIIGDLDYEQTTDLLGGGAFNARVIEDTFDRTVIQIQQLEERLDRALLVPVNSSANVQLPNPEANELIGWNSGGTALQNVAVADLATAVAYGTFRYDTFTGTGAQTQFTLSDDPATIGNLDVSISGVVQVPGIDYSLTSGVLIFTSAPANGTTILARYGEAMTSAPGDAADISFHPAGTGAVTRTAQSKMRDVVSVKDFGAVGDGVTDDTAAIQSAINYAQQTGLEIYFPSGKYKTTSTLTISSGVSLIGDAPQSQTSYLPGIGQLGGSWIYFDHTGVGIAISNATNVADDVLIEKLGTYRNQPAPAPGWTPTANDWDLSCYGASDVVLRDVFMLNATKGIVFTGTPVDTAGRLEIYNFKAQAFQKGIVIDTAYDVCRLDNIHIWPFWKDDANIHAYTLSNLDAIQSTRNDNPLMSNVFTIFARAGLRLSQNANGSTAKLHLVNADFDRGKYGIWVDPTVTVADGQFENITSQGETGLNGSIGVYLQGTNTSLYFGNYSSAYSWFNAVRVEGTGNRVTFAAAKANQYDKAASNFPAFEAATNNWLIFATEPEDYNAGGIGGTFSTTGNIVADKWRSFAPTVTASSGAITSYTSVGKFKVVGDTVHVQIVVELTNNGTGAGQLRATLPFGIPINRFVGAGRELATTGNALIATIAPSASYAEITTYNNTYPGGTGSLVNCVFQYDVNV